MLFSKFVAYQWDLGANVSTAESRAHCRDSSDSQGRLFILLTWQRSLLSFFLLYVQNVKYSGHKL